MFIHIVASKSGRAISSLPSGDNGQIRTHGGSRRRFPFTEHATSLLLSLSLCIPLVPFQTISDQLNSHNFKNAQHNVCLIKE